MAAPTKLMDIRRWVDTWKRAGPELEKQRIAELRALTEEESAALFDSMKFDPDAMWLPPDRIESAGMITQQRLFMRFHEHPASRRRSD